MSKSKLGSYQGVLSIHNKRNFEKQAKDGCSIVDQTQDLFRDTQYANVKFRKVSKKTKKW